MDWGFCTILLFHSHKNSAKILCYSFLMPFGVTLSATALTAWTTSFRCKDAASFKNGSFNVTCLYTGMVDVSVS